MSAWAFKWYQMNQSKVSPLMEIMQEKLHALTWQETKELAEEIGVTPITLWSWRTGHVRHGSGMVMSLLCVHFGIIKGETPHLSEDDQIALEIRWKRKQRKEPKLTRAEVRAKHRRKAFRVA